MLYEVITSLCERYDLLGALSASVAGVLRSQAERDTRSSEILVKEPSELGSGRLPSGSFHVVVSASESRNNFV